MSRSSAQETKPLRVAIVHDYLREYGGAERVVEALHEMFPSAPVYVAFVDATSLGSHWERFRHWDIRTTWATKIPGIKILYSPLRVLADRFFGSLKLSEYDVVISSTNMYMAKAVRVQSPAIHICYCHTPPRSLYGYTTMTDWKKNPIIRVLGELNNHYMRWVDWKTSKLPTQFVANSKEVQDRISKFYRRTSVIIYPPVHVPEHLPDMKKKGYCLIVSRLAASKHVDLAVRACSELGVELKVVGSGKMLPQLQSIAGASVQFLGAVNDTELRRLYAEANLVLYPAEDEDFGIVPVEAMAYGTPVIVHRSGGAKETVLEDQTGIFVGTFEVSEMKTAIRKALKKTWDTRVLHDHAKKFSVAHFQTEMRNLIHHLMA